MKTTMNLHKVKAIHAGYTEGRTGGKWIDITFESHNGSTLVVTAFVDGPLVIEGADLLALMTMPAPEAA